MRTLLSKNKIDLIVSTQGGILETQTLIKLNTRNNLYKIYGVFERLTHAFERVLLSQTWTRPSQRAFPNSSAFSLMTTLAPAIWRRCAGLTASLARHAGTLASLIVSQPA